jgi:tetratricopeptide (TPR) repeat protein
LQVLVGGGADRPERQHTLRATIAWSYGLLGPSDRALFRRLSVFVGGAALEAVEAICGTPVEADRDVLSGVAALVDQSLVQAGVDEEEPRVRLLETIREYGQERLAESGEEQTLRRRHAEYYLALAEAAELRLRGPEQAKWLGRLEREHDNLRASLTWSREQAAETGLRLAGALWRFWYAHGHLSEGRHWLEAVLEKSGMGPAPARAKALNAAGVLSFRQGDYGRATALHEEGLALCQESGDKAGSASALNNLGNVVCRQGNYELAKELFDKALALYYELGNDAGSAAALANLGIVAWEQGDYGRATALIEKGLAMRREMGDTWGIANSLDSLGGLAYAHGDYERATALYEESVALFREVGDTGGIATALNSLGDVARAQGDHARATALYEESLLLRRELGLTWGIAVVLNDLGNLTYEQGDHGRAATLHTEALVLCQTIGDKRQSALCLEGLAAVAIHEQPERAARLLGAAAAARLLINAPLPLCDRPRYERLVAAVRANLDGVAFAAAWAAGEVLTLEEAGAEALHEQGLSAAPSTTPHAPVRS